MDRRTKRQKLLDMANQSVSPNEAEIAKQKLAELKEDDKPKIFGPGKIISEITIQFDINNSSIGSFNFRTNEWEWVVPPKWRRTDIKTSDLGGE